MRIISLGWGVQSFGLAAMSALGKAIGNGVPLPMGRPIARAVLNAVIK